MLGVVGPVGRASRRLGNRGGLNSKRGNKGFYKGKGGRKEGKHTKHGAYVVQEHKLMEIVAPAGLSDTKLKPYVAWDTVAPRKPADALEE